jgi:uncharacterized protein YdaU (DUF1376 family)
MAKGEQKVYMPVFVGDWLKGTRGMKADVRGVYFGLLLHQWENGFIPDDVYELEEIEREVNKVWDKLKHKFVQVAPGKLQNKKLEEVREFFKKQKKNGQLGGRPKKRNPKHNPNETQPITQTETFNNGIGIGNDSGFKYQYKESNDFSKPDVEGEEIVFPVDSPLMRELWSGWKRYRWEAHRARYGIMGEQADLKRLQGMPFQRIEETILAAIGGTWKNLYPERNGKTTHNSTNKKQQQSDASSDYLQDYYAAKASSNS